MPSSTDPPSTVTTEGEIVQKLRDKAEGTELRVPPRCFEEMSGEMQRYDPETQTLRVKFPVEERYENPTGVMQGGFLCAALDNVLGPLSYLVAPPSATTQLNVTFLRPITPQHEYILVEAEAEERAGKQVQLSGRVLTPGGKPAATGTATCRIFGRTSSRPDEESSS